MKVAGALADVDRLVVSTTVEQLGLKLFDYALANDGPIELSLEPARPGDRPPAGRG